MDYTPPYDQLYIYHITGPLCLDGSGHPEHFIGQWIEAQDSFLFFDQKSDETVHRWLSDSPTATLEGTFEMSYMDWLGGQFSVFSAGLFTVFPAWEKKKTLLSDDCAYPIFMDPGVVFGAGTHTTTRNCLEAIDLLYYLDTPKTILDMGSGTGILGIAAVLRGGETATLIDNNPLCTRTAERNIGLNQVSDQVRALTGDACLHAPATVDLLIANIHYDILQHLLTSAILRTKKWLILSGILSSEVSKVVDAVSLLPTEIIRHWNTDSIWHTFLIAVFPDLFEKETV